MNQTQAPNERRPSVSLFWGSLRRFFGLAFSVRSSPYLRTSPVALVAKTNCHEEATATRAEAGEGEF